jgi:hypothetical protein
VRALNFTKNKIMAITERQAENHIEACLKSMLKSVKRYPVKKLTCSVNGIVEINDTVQCISVNQLATLCKTQDFTLKKYEKSGILPVSQIAERRTLTKFGDEVAPKRLYPLVPAINAAKVYLMNVKKGTSFAPPVSTQFVKELNNFSLLIKQDNGTNPTS